ncbi:MAG: glycosyltransferase family 2 protein [Hyphomonadaceae bacterium]|nr:glycosyltransferase family 2 protein [Clostridia bacterium]
MEKKLLSVVVPMYYEELVAGACYGRLTAVLEKMDMPYEIVFVNDGSKDKTFDILKGFAVTDKCVKIINFSRNFGHQMALTAGVTYAKGDVVVVIDADLQDPPELIPDMVALWREGWEVVYAKRKKRKGETWFKLLTAKMFYRILDKLSDVKIPTDTGDFRLMDRKVVDAFKQLPERNRFIRGMVSWLGFKQTPIEYERDQRFAGETKYPFKKMLKFAWDGIVSFSLKPLKIVGYLGIASMGFAICLFIYSVAIRLLNIETNPAIPGWTSLMTAITFFSGVQLLSIAILGEYIGRIYDESKGRPLYLITELVNFEEK